MINTLVDCLLSFYQLEEKVPLRALSRELFVNLVTNLILSKELYFLVFHLTSATLETQQRILRKVMFSNEFLENTLPITNLKLSPQFQFDVNYRLEFKKKSEDSLSFDENGE